MGYHVIRHDVRCDPATYWRCFFFDAEYNRRLHLEAFRYSEFEQLSFEETPTQIVRKLQLRTPTSGISGAVVERYLGNQAWVESGVFDKVTQRFTVEYDTGKLRDRIAIHGEMRVEERAAGRVERIAEMRLAADIGLLRPLLEAGLGIEVRLALAAQARFTNAYLSETAG